MHRNPTVLTAFAGLLLLASIPATAAAEEIEFCARNDGLFQARIGVDYRIPRRAIPRDYASTGFSMGGKRCLTVPSNAEGLRVRVDAEVKPGRWKTLCERGFVKAEEAAGLLLVAEGSKITPSCK